MIVKDLFNKISFETLWNYFYENRLKDDKDTKEIIENARLCHEAAYYRIKKLDPVINEDNILIFYKAIDTLDDDVVPYEYDDVSLYSISEVKEVFKIDEKVESDYDFSKLNCDEIRRYFIDEKTHVTSYAFDLSPWNEILGYTLDEKSLKDVGELVALSSVFFEMTFCGFEEDTIEEKRDEIIARKEECDKAIEEGNTGYFKTLDEIFPDWEQYKPTEEDHKRTYLYSIDNWKRIYYYLKNIAN